MTMGYNPFDPMCKSEYMSYTMPIESVIDSVSVPPAFTTPLNTNPAAPQMAPQLKEDKFYKFDGNNDGKISKWEKIKAFCKGSTYNVVNKLFCNEKGFSFKKTALTLASGAALALVGGPIGVAVAGGIGLVAGLSKFFKGCKLSNSADNDFDARKAYENLGEATTTIGLSLFGGFKGLKFMRNNAKFIKTNPSQNYTWWQKVRSWKLS